ASAVEDMNESAQGAPMDLALAGIDLNGSSSGPSLTNHSQDSEPFQFQDAPINAEGKSAESTTSSAQAVSEQNLERESPFSSRPPNAGHSRGDEIDSSEQASLEQ